MLSCSYPLLNHTRLITTNFRKQISANSHKIKWGFSLVRGRDFCWLVFIHIFLHLSQTNSGLIFNRILFCRTKWGLLKKYRISQSAASKFSFYKQKAAENFQITKNIRPNRNETFRTQTILDTTSLLSQKSCFVW